jgi:hypothetical protein
VIGALASVLVGHYVADVLVMGLAGVRFEGSVQRREILATLLAAVTIGWLWLAHADSAASSMQISGREPVWVGIGTGRS